MAEVADGFEQWLRNYQSAGMPGSGVNEPSKAEGRAIGDLIEAYVSRKVLEAQSAGGAIEILCDLSRAEDGAVATGDGAFTFTLPTNIQFQEVRASLVAGSSSGDVEIDITIAGESILSDSLTVEEGETTGALDTDATGDDGALVSIDVTADGTGAEGLKVWLIGTRRSVSAAAMPYYVTNGGITNSFSTTPAVPYPATEDGDFLILQANSQVTTGTPTLATPAGWTLLYGPQRVDDGSVHIVTYTFWKRADGTETGNVTLGWSALHFTTSVISAWRGVVASGDPIESVAHNDGHSTTMSGSDVVTTGDGRRVVNLYHIAANAISTGGAGWSTIYQQLAGAAFFGSIGASAKAADDAGNVDAEDRGLDGNYVWASLSFALIPAVIV